MLLSDVIIAARDSGQTEPTIAPFKGQILSIEFEGLKSPACRQPLLNGLKVMATTKSLLTDEELGVIVQNVNDILEAAFGDDDFRY
jgi:DNA repair/transcription protein MET18/MMS19